MRFGKSSEPTLVTGGAPFASGLSPKGRLISAAGVGASFYGTPLVAWTPALGADAYHVQWSKKRYPFTAELSGGTAGFLTLSTSAVLPLKPGTWWYRVRGISWRLPAERAVHVVVGSDAHRRGAADLRRQAVAVATARS